MSNDVKVQALSLFSIKNCTMTENISCCKYQAQVFTHTQKMFCIVEARSHAQCARGVEKCVLKELSSDLVLNQQCCEREKKYKAEWIRV